MRPAGCCCVLCCAVFWFTTADFMADPHNGMACCKAGHKCRCRAGSVFGRLCGAAARLCRPASLDLGLLSQHPKHEQVRTRKKHGRAGAMSVFTGACATYD